MAWGGRGRRALELLSFGIAFGDVFLHYTMLFFGGEWNGRDSFGLLAVGTVGDIASLVLVLFVPMFAASWETALWRGQGILLLAACCLHSKTLSRRWYWSRHGLSCLSSCQLRSLHESTTLQQHRREHQGGQSEGVQLTSPSFRGRSITALAQRTGFVKGLLQNPEPVMAEAQVLETPSGLPPWP